ncbi:SURF1 family protein [Sphingobium sp. H39-3-25]|uniref:SURF1 family protein n=1 Tax=Sphingobium arseniciresistens TaxID=3030834 RepID=UPI0023B9A1F5|nr:SURF1 family protein [Sphingobium arseniciresistens]
MMTRRLPLIATIVVLAAVATMIGLGVWQLQRHAEKTAVLAELRANPGRPSTSFPHFGPVDPALLFRRSSLHCLRVVGWREEAGRAADGSTGYRAIADCATGAEGPGALVTVGVAPRPGVKPAWTGGQVEGWISEEPDHRSLLSRMGGKAMPLRPMLIARTPAAGLKAAAPPSPDDVPNNHLAYAVQWFFFAAVALVIYALALRKRWLEGDVGKR